VNNNPVVFLDSGIGGLPYCRHFQVHNPNETIIYIADRANFPYGPKDRDTLVGLLCSLIDQIRCAFMPKLVVIACNAASVSALSPLRSAFPDLLFVGTVPAIKPAVQNSQTRKIGVLGTERTIADSCIGELASLYGPDCTIIGIAAPDLIEFVEHQWVESNEAHRYQAVVSFVEQFRNKGADAVVLGCTHFLLLQNEFVTAGAPDIHIYDSIEGVCHQAETMLDVGDIHASGTDKECLLVVTGSSPLEKAWGNYAGLFALKLRRLQDIV
jgi:glutamate racemase